MTVESTLNSQEFFKSCFTALHSFRTYILAVVDFFILFAWALIDLAVFLPVLNFSLFQSTPPNDIEIIVALVMVFPSAIGEELFFRSWLMSKIGLVAHAPIFGFLHMLNGTNIGGAILITIDGLFYGTLYKKYGFSTSVCVHALGNIIIYLLMLLR